MWLKSLISQLILAAIVLGGAVALWIEYVPEARPWLQEVGVYETLGLTPPEPEEAAAPAFRRGGAVQVVTQPVALGTLNDRISAIGDGRAARSVAVRSEAAGRITEVGFAAGEEITEGAVIFRLDDEAERIALDRARLMLTDARDNTDRLDRLRRSGTASAVALREAELQLRTAELAVRQAEFDLTQREVIAPISGWIGLVEVEVGDRVSAQEDLALISDRSEILIDFALPERVLAKLRPGMPLIAEPLALTGETIEGKVLAIDNKVDRNSRTVRILGEVPNEGDRLRDGMAMSVTVAFQGDPFPLVDPLSVQWSSEGAFVWVVREGKAQTVPVKIRQRNADSVLIEAALDEGEPVVTEGTQSLRPGAEVEMIGDQSAADDAPTQDEKS
ncbi:efflux RND transporter periplasmic adaptor subunit [Pseudooceanicola sp.]|uniref:efflux RND transporter periplasmic adaptor subunit n=1 Tax=Pseudooceanicola sp. TaxID=1914328 RepID=UPI0035C735B0